MRGGLHLRVMEGATGRVLQDLRLDEEETGLDPLAMRLRVLAQLRQRATELVDQRSTVVLVELYPIDQVEVREALDAAQAGRWGEARRGLEAFVRSNAFRALPSDQQAHVLYDLGQARRFDARERTASRFLRAERALRAAVRLLPRPQFARAIADLEEDRRSRAMVRVQREAMVHNFALAQVELPVVATGDEDADGAAQR